MVMIRIAIGKDMAREQGYGTWTNELTLLMTLRGCADCFPDKLEIGGERATKIRYKTLTEFLCQWIKFRNYNYTLIFLEFL
jgi:hypothetical protein